MKTIILLIVIFSNNGITIQEKELNCEYLFFSGQGTEIENQICAEEYEIINQETLDWKRQALENRGIY